jgi:hypothetical protein
MYKVTIDLADGSTLVFDNVIDYDVDDANEVEENPLDEEEEESSEETEEG